MRAEFEYYLYTSQISNAFPYCFSEIADFADFSFALISLAAIFRDDCTVKQNGDRTSVEAASP